MEKYFGNAYRGDPGVPHAGGHRFGVTWAGSALFSLYTWFNPYLWQHANTYNWHDRAFLYEQYHWQKAMREGKPYKFNWNKQPREIRDAYYYNWRDLFP